MWTLVVRRSAPQEMTRSDSVTVSGSAPPTLPHAASQPASAQESQTVPAQSRVTPSAWNKPSKSPRFSWPWCAL
jgi:hypothetical protein